MKQIVFNADVVMRLPADNPVPEPDGIGAEVFDFSLLSEINSYKKC